MTLPGVHRPRRPQWDCEQCSAPYVCPGGQQELRAQFGLTIGLGRHLYRLLEQAVADQPEASVADLYDRLLRWADTDQPVGSMRSTARR